MRRGFGGFGGRRGIGMGLGRRLMRPRFARNPLGHQAKSQLMRANQLILAGEAIQAAAIFAGIAAFAQQNGMPARGANLSARAALAYFEAGDIVHGKEYALSAVQQSVSAGSLDQAVRIAGQVLSHLKARGLAQDADEMRASFDALLSPYGVSLANTSAVPAAAPRKLPAQCPACLGPVRPDAVEWIDDQTAECAYCGSILQAE